MPGSLRSTCRAGGGRGQATGRRGGTANRATPGRAGLATALLDGWWLVCLVLALGAGAVSADTASARVIEVTGDSSAAAVLLSVGRVDGLAEDSPVTLLRQAAPIVHPLTGEVLGVPQEPVGLVQLDRVEERQARGHMVKAYTTPRVGDLAEYQRRLPAPAPAAPTQPAAASQAPSTERPERLDRVVERVDDLERTLHDYRASQQKTARAGDLGQEAWDELTSMKSYLRTLDRRLASLETSQAQDRERLNSVVRGEFPAGETKELTIRYSPDTDVKLRVAGRTLTIAVERDSLRLVEVATPAEIPSPTAPPVEPTPLPAAVSTPAPAALDSGAVPPLAEPPAAIVAASSSAPATLPAASEGGGFNLSVLSSPYVQAGSLALIALLAGVLYYLMRRRETALAGEFEDLERGFLDDEEEDER